MSQTRLSIEGDRFLINEELVYSEVERCRHKGLLMNARFIQGVFDETLAPERFDRFGKSFDPDKNTEALIDSLQEWYDYGLRAITVGFQGGGPCFTVKNDTMKNHPYHKSTEGMMIDKSYSDRMLKIIEAADQIGMVVIVSCFYPGQVRHFECGEEIYESVQAVCRFINDSGYENIILEICNEFDLCRNNPLIGTGEGMSTLIHTARKALTKEIPVGSSLAGGQLNEAVAKASDVVLIHGNGCSRQKYYNLVHKAKEYAEGKPVVCNEDSQVIGNMLVSMEEGVSWGYYNNMTKQEPPVDWTVTKGEDMYFAKRMAMALEIMDEDAHEAMEDNYYLQGIDEGQVSEGEYFVRLASLYPEKIDWVCFYKNGEHFYTCYDEPFTVNYFTNWRQFGMKLEEEDLVSVKIRFRDGAEKFIGSEKVLN